MIPNIIPRISKGLCSIEASQAAFDHDTLNSEEAFLETFVHYFLEQVHSMKGSNTGLTPSQLNTFKAKV